MLWSFPSWTSYWTVLRGMVASLDKPVTSNGCCTALVRLVADFLHPTLLYVCDLVPHFHYYHPSRLGFDATRLFSIAKFFKTNIIDFWTNTDCEYTQIKFVDCLFLIDFAAAVSIDFMESQSTFKRYRTLFARQWRPYIALDPTHSHGEGWPLLVLSV